MNETSNRCTQLSRRLKANKPVTGELLAFALSLVPDRNAARREYDEVWADAIEKLKAGEPLYDYAYHLLVDVILLHVRLQANAAERQLAAQPNQTQEPGAGPGTSR